MKRFFWILVVISLLAACGSDGEGSSEDTSPQQPSATETITESTPTPDNTELAARVNGTPITMATFEAELAAVAASLAGVASSDALGETVLSQLIDQVLVEQYATANNITIDDAIFQAELESLNTLAAESGFTVAEVLGLPVDTNATMVEQEVYALLLTQAVADDVIANTPLVNVQVRARHILVRDESLAREILDELQNGADFATLAATYSIDTATAPAGGDLGWIAPGDLLLDTVEQIIFNLDAGFRYPDPVPSDLGWHIIEVLERDETQSLTDEQISKQRIQIFQTWLADQRRMATVERFIS